MIFSRRDKKDDYESAVRFLQDFSMGSLRSSMDVVLEETDSTSSSRSPPKMCKAKTCECLSSLMSDLSSETLVSNERRQVEIRFILYGPRFVGLLCG